MHVDLLRSNHNELVVARCHRITRTLENIGKIQDQLESFPVSHAHTLHCLTGSDTQSKESVRKHCGGVTAMHSHFHDCYSLPHTSMHVSTYNIYTPLDTAPQLQFI